MSNIFIDRSVDWRGSCRLTTDTELASDTNSPTPQAIESANFDRAPTRSIEKRVEAMQSVPNLAMTLTFDFNWGSLHKR